MRRITGERRTRVRGPTLLAIRCRPSHNIELFCFEKEATMSIGSDSNRIGPNSSKTKERANSEKPCCKTLALRRTEPFLCLPSFIQRFRIQYGVYRVALCSNKCSKHAAAGSKNSKIWNSGSDHAMHVSIVSLTPIET